MSGLACAKYMSRILLVTLNLTIKGVCYSQKTYGWHLASQSTFQLHDL